MRTKVDLCVQRAQKNSGREVVCPTEGLQQRLDVLVVVFDLAAEAAQCLVKAAYCRQTLHCQHGEHTELGTAEQVAVVLLQKRKKQN